MVFPKKQGQRLIPEYLLDYTTKLNESHPDPTQSWGGGSGGSDYTAGDGINISSGNVISVDNTIAKKSEIPSLDGYATQTWVQEQGYKTSITSSDITSALGYTPGTSNFSGSYNELTDTPTFATVATSGSYNDLSDKPVIPDTTNFVTTDTIQKINVTKYFGSGTLVVEDGAYILSHYTDMFKFADGTGVIDFELPTNKTKGTVSMPEKYTLATIDDIPTVPTLATVATTGSYNDLIDKPTIPDTSNFVTLDSNQTISGAKTFQGGLITENTTFGIKMNILPSRFQYDYNNQGTIERTLFDLPNKTAGTEGAPTTYTLATQDDIPTVNNPTITFTQGGATKGTITLNQSGDQTIEFDAGSGGGGGGTPTNMVTTDTKQDITGEKTFVGTKRIKFKQNSQNDRLGFTGYDANGTEIGYLEMSKRDGDFTGSPISNMLGYWSNVNSAPNPSSDVMLGFKYYTRDSDGNIRDYKLVVPPRYNETRATRYIPISVNGNTADNTGNINVPTQTLVFTLADNSTVEVNVMTSATASTTNTVS